MSVLLEGKCVFSDQENDFLRLVSSNNFPWYAGLATKNFPVLTHDLMKRSEEQTAGIPNSPFYPDAMMMLRRLCKENNVTLRTIYRMSFNLTFADPSKHGDPHIDHPSFEHKNILIYLNTFEAGETFLLDETGTNVVQAIKPARDKFVIFDGDWHAQGFCKPQQMRMVFVATFDGDVMPVENSKAA
jgi:hypothetical protein